MMRCAPGWKPRAPSCIRLVQFFAFHPLEGVVLLCLVRREVVNYLTGYF